MPLMWLEVEREGLHSCPSTIISCWHRERVKLLQVVFVVGNGYVKMFDEVFGSAIST
jgi:hypothetical protein